MTYLVIGLGNPGATYQGTRHNLGFAVVDQLAQQQQAVFAQARLAHISQITYRARRIHLVKPTTYMNASGQAVRYWKQHLGIPLERMLVVTDDMHLPFGKMRLRLQGSHGGHNGLRSIEQQLATQHYARLRLGIGRAFAPGQQAAYVLDTFAPQEQQLLPGLLQQAAALVLHSCFQGFVAHSLVQPAGGW